VDVTHCFCSSNRNSIDEEVVHQGVQACFWHTNSRPQDHMCTHCVTCSR
jgi:hypothetical protein